MQVQALVERSSGPHQNIGRSCRATQGSIGELASTTLRRRIIWHDDH
jgi:hypothetical protein